MKVLTIQNIILDNVKSHIKGSKCQVCENPRLKQTERFSHTKLTEAYPNYIEKILKWNSSDRTGYFVYSTLRLTQLRFLQNYDKINCIVVFGRVRFIVMNLR